MGSTTPHARLAAGLSRKVSPMAALPQLLDGTLLPAGTAAAIYLGTISAVALTAALARDPQRRRDARETLKVLLRKTNGR